MSPEHCPVSFVSLTNFMFVSLTVIQCFVAESSDVRHPFGPRMCEEICRTFTHCADSIFDEADLTCYLTKNSSQRLKHSQLTRLEVNKKQQIAPKGKSRDISTRHHGQKYVKSESGIDTYQQKLSPLCVSHSEKCTTSGHHSTHVSTITLHQACWEGKLKVVKDILSQKLQDINSRDNQGKTPVMATVLTGRTHIFEFLVSQGCNLTAVDNYDQNVLHLACKNGHTDIVKILIESHKCDIDSRGNFNKTPLMYAASRGWLDVVKLLINKGCNQELVNINHDNALHSACLYGHVKVAKYILSKGKLQIDCKGNNGRTPVMRAARKGYGHVVKTLVGKGCNVTTIDIFGNNLLHVACMGVGRHQIDIVKYLLSLNKIARNHKNVFGKTPTQLPACKRYRSLFKSTRV